MSVLSKIFLHLALAAGLNADTVNVKIDADRPNPWNNLKLNNAPGTFRFAIVTDRTGGHRPGVFETGVEKLNLLQPEFVMSVGDFIEGYTQDLEQIGREWEEFDGFIKRLTVPFFYVPGNHDVTNPVMLKYYKERFGRDYYHFTYRNVLFICLNSDDPYPAKIGKEQLDYVAKALEENKEVRWTLVFLHRPLWAGGDHENKKGLAGNGWLDMEKLLRGRPYTVFAGHAHEYRKTVRQDRRYITLATTGGGSGMRGPAFGEFDHVAWVTMSDSGPQLANLLLEGIWHEDVSTDASVRMMDFLTKAIPSQDTHLFTEEAVLSGAKARLRVSNEADQPLKALLEFPDYAPLRPKALRQQKVVPPNSVAFFDLDLKGLGELKASQLGTLPYEWTLSYDSKMDPPLKTSGTSYLYVESPLSLPARAKPVVVDGKLKEWGDLPQVVDQSRPMQRDRKQWTGPEDVSFRFAVEHDAANLYLAVDVVDDQWVRGARSGDGVWNQDGVWLSVEAQPEIPGENPAMAKDEARIKAEEKSKGKAWSTFLVPGKTAADGLDVAKAQGWGGEGVQAACLKTPKGYTAEMAIPYADLAARLGKPRQALRVTVNAYDFDPGDEHRGGIYFNFRPEQKSANFYSGAGLFYLDGKLR